MHGRYPDHLKSDELHKRVHLLTCVLGTSFLKRRGRLMAIQDHVVPTRMYMIHIDKQNIPTDRCRRFFQGPEPIQHITSSCPILAPREYLQSHTLMDRIYHQRMALNLGLLKNEVEQHPYQPNTVLLSSLQAVLRRDSYDRPRTGSS